MKESYIETPRFHAKSIKQIAVIDQIIQEYDLQGYKLTVRQLYYQMVARGYIENTVRSYDNIVVLLTNARLCGLLDWDAIEDRTRGFIDRPHWDSGKDILNAAADSYHEDLWDEQDTRIFVVVEKEALAGVLEPICREYDIPLLAARGYPSATTLREFAKYRLMYSEQNIVILHLGDHDPSGIDMSRDLKERLQLFSRGTVDIDFNRVALNMEQVEALRPPPNPAKVTDSRYNEYKNRFGEESWELDALSPQYLNDLIRENVEHYIDSDALENTKERIQSVRSKINKIALDFERT